MQRSTDREEFAVEQHDLSRRNLLKGGGAMLAGLTVLQVAGPSQAFAASADDGGDDIADDRTLDPANTIPGGDVIKWDDQPADIPPPAQDVIGHPLEWENLNSWLTPNDQFFTVKHYNQPELAADTWQLDIGGLVNRPRTLTLADIKARARRQVDFTLECSGNTGLPFFIGGIGNARWAGASLASLLKEARVMDEGTEVVFWGADSGTVTILDDSGITGGGTTGTFDPDGSGNHDLTITEQFARSMSVEDAMNPENLLCYEMNGKPLPAEHGSPVRLIAPGWYGVANVKWLTRIEVMDRRYTGRFMARDYVTIREQADENGQTVWTFTNVGHDRLKSAPAKVTRQGNTYSIFGAAWGAPISAVKVKIDDQPWTRAKLVGPQPRNSKSRGFAWRFWTLPWDKPAPGSHTITSQAFDVNGIPQPAPDDPFLASKHTYWESNGLITRHITIPG
jgi:DMSO/TMAO reductase YedYZ molybdopterin-dependent catalytic subunit